MGRSIRPTSRFKKDLRLMKRRGKDIDKLEKIVTLLAHDQPFALEHRDHSLKGERTNHRECHIEANWLLIYRKIDNELILFRTGSHSDLFD
jgi:mRNA interferase YafQ